MNTEDRQRMLDSVRDLLRALEEENAVYEVREFAALVHRSPLTVRAWLREGRLHGKRKNHQRGPHRRWVIEHAELLRFRRDGLLPASTAVRE